MAHISAKYGSSNPPRIELIAWGHVLACVDTHKHIIKHSNLESGGATLPVRTRRTCLLLERFVAALAHFIPCQIGQRAQSIEIAPSKHSAVYAEKLASSLYTSTQDGTNIIQPASADPNPHDSLPEWSRGVDSSSTSASCVGSDPSAVIWDCSGSSGWITHIKELPICFCYLLLNNLRFKDWLHAGGSSKITRPYRTALPGSTPKNLARKTSQDRV